MMAKILFLILIFKCSVLFASSVDCKVTKLTKLTEVADITEESSSVVRRLASATEVFSETQLSVLRELNVVEPELSKLVGTIQDLGINSPEGILEFIKFQRSSKLSAKEIVAALLNKDPSITGLKFEEYLVENVPGLREGFKIGHPKAGGAKRDFDVVTDDAWVEAKSGRYWEKNYTDNPGKFQSDMSTRQKIARLYGKDYHLISDTPIPEAAKKWLRKRGISYIAPE